MQWGKTNKKNQIISTVFTIKAGTAIYSELAITQYLVDQTNYSNNKGSLLTFVTIRSLSFLKDETK